ncbi:MAG: tryptophan synthase subunit alpha [Desulfotomaculales bacterium]
MRGEERIAKRFAEITGAGEKGLITYLVAGDPDLEATGLLAEAMTEAGADFLELGIPFSDPVADGPVIQMASFRALKNGVKINRILELVLRVRSRTEVPIILMTYYNPVLQYDLVNFVRESARVGVDGIIVPDLPFEEAAPLLAATDSYGLALVPLVAPTTSRERLKKFAFQARGFVYGVSVTGVTGTREHIHTDLAAFSRRVREEIKLPFAIGFGIAGPRQAAAVVPFCDAVVVGSAIVGMVAEEGISAVPRVTGFVRQLKASLKEMRGLPFSKKVW